MESNFVSCFSDRKLTRKTVNRPTLRSPKSKSSSNCDNRFFVKNLTKKFLTIENQQKKLFEPIRMQADPSQQGQKEQSLQRSKSENQLNRTKKQRQNTLKKDCQDQRSAELKLKFNTKTKTSLIEQKHDKCIEQLKAQNFLLRQMLDNINKRFQNSLKGKYQSRVQSILNQSISNNRFTDVASKIKDTRIQELEKLNWQLSQEIKILRRQLKGDWNQQLKSELKRQIKNGKNLGWFLQIQKTKKKQQAINIQNRYIQLKSYVQELEYKYKILREQNQKIKIEVDCINRKSYSQIQILKKANIKEMSSIKEKYFKLLEEHKNLTKQHYDLTLKFKKLEKQFIATNIDAKLLQTSLTLSQSLQVHEIQ